MTFFGFMVVWGVTFAVVFSVLLALINRRLTRPQQQLPVREFPLAGCDPRVRAVIERGGSDAELIAAAEAAALREHVRSVTPDHQQNHDAIHAALSLPHVTATTPRVTYWLTPKCDDCEFEVASSLGGEVAIPIRTVICPRHQED